MRRYSLGFSETQIKLLKILSEEGPKIRRDLVKDLNLPRTTIYDNLMRLIRKGLVCKWEYYDGNKGRPPVYFEIREEKKDEIERLLNNYEI